MSIDAVLATTASAQHGLLTHGQCRTLGLSDDAISLRVESGRWERLASGVYAIGGSPASFRRRVLAACLATSGAVASHVTAARLHGVGYLPDDRRIHLSAPLGVSPRSALAVVHRRRDLGSDVVAMRGCIPLTTIDRTMLDLAAVTPRGRFEIMFDDALDRRLTSWDRLQSAVEIHARRGRSGVSVMRTLLLERGDGLAATQSTLERRFVAFCRHRGLPEPDLQHPLVWRGRVVGLVDACYRSERVVVELDGRRNHTQLTHRERDLVRDQQAAAQGWLTVRVSWRQLHEQPDALEERLSAVLRSRRQR